ncbi:type VII secretion-associated serine protease mycosin [Streptomyces sp. NPDC005125]
MSRPRRHSSFGRTSVRRTGNAATTTAAARALGWAAALTTVTVTASMFLAPPAVALPSSSPHHPPAVGQECTPATSRTVPDLPWSQARLQLERVWEVTKGAAQTVAVIDSGVDSSVPQLRGHVLRGSDVVAKSGRGDTDCVGHGTFVAGIIAAQPKKQLRFMGVAPGATILPVRQTTDGKDGSADSMARAITTAVDAGAQVINISANSTGPSASLRSAVAYAVKNDVLIVAAVGNQERQEEGRGPSYPASYPDVLGVAAVGRDDQPASFSRQGDFVDVAAPGVDIISLSRGGPGYVIDQGTSFAAPFVAGTAALVRAYHPELTVRQLILRLQFTADRPLSSVPDPQVGWGIVNPFKAVTAIVPEERSGGATGGKTPSATAPTVIPGGIPAAQVQGGSDFGQLPLFIGVGGVVLLFGLGVLAARISTRRR